MTRSGLLRFSDAASLALHAVAVMAARPERLLTNREIARTLGCSADHLAKVLQRLTKARLVESVRGPKGGVQLAREPALTSLLQVYEAIEGPLVASGCLLGQPVCSGKNCIVDELVCNLGGQMMAYLAGTRLDQLRAFRDHEAPATAAPPAIATAAPNAGTRRKPAGSPGRRNRCAEE
ncbi:MAG: Rrf2 family transcriptional regulator [Candidatus Riflebacteria bacterium]|nr:Rrf2 family transcriptional regulator [Candidatus Riflebacteria bacterium]